MWVDCRMFTLDVDDFEEETEAEGVAPWFTVRPSNPSLGPSLSIPAQAKRITILDSERRVVAVAIISYCRLSPADVRHVPRGGRGFHNTTAQISEVSE